MSRKGLFKQRGQMWGGLSWAKGASRLQNLKWSDVSRALLVAREGGKQELSENRELHLPREDVWT